MSSITSKLWQLLVLGVIFFMVINLAIVAVQPYLPLIGIMVVIAIGAGIIRLLMMRKRPY